MAGLLLLFVGIAWLLTCIWLAKLVAGAARSGPAKALVACGAFIALFIAPIVDDILGTRQYKRYCAAADNVKVLGTIGVSPSAGLYTESGEWRLAKLEPGQHDERHRLGRLAERLVRWNHGTSTPTESVFPIDERTTRIYDAASERLLVEWKSYHYRGGFLRSNLLDSASQCFPSLFGSSLYPRLFVLQPS